MSALIIVMMSLAIGCETTNKQRRVSAEGPSLVVVTIPLKTEARRCPPDVRRQHNKVNERSARKRRPRGNRVAPASDVVKRADQGTKVKAGAADDLQPKVATDRPQKKKRPWVPERLPSWTIRSHLRY